MWTLLFFLYLGTLDFTVSSSPPSPVNVVFSSVNLRNVLHWSPGNSTSEDTLFTVQYAIYGDSVEGSKGRRVNWRAVWQCTDIARSWCDLSNETWDQEQGYYARVRVAGRRASSKWTMTLRRFDPKLDTSLGPPMVSVETEGNNAIIALKGPMRYQPNNHTPVISMATIYPHMTYNLSIRNGHHGQTHYFPVLSRLFKHQVKHQTEYCFSAKTRLVSIPMQCESSAWHCITTPPDPVTFHLLSLVWGIAVPSLCLCALMVVGYFLHNYLMGKGQKKPNTLNTSSFHPRPLILPPENANFIIISVIKYESDMDSAISDLACYKKKIADPPAGYSLQEPRAPPENDALLADYAFVGATPQINVGGEEEARDPWQDRDDGNNLIGERQKCDKKEWRVEDGHSAGVFSPQAKSNLSQTHVPTYSQTHARTGMSTLVQAQSKSLSLSQIQGSLLSDQKGTYGDRECPGSVVNKTPQTGLFHDRLNLQTRMKLEMGGKMEEKARVRTDGKIDGAAEEASKSETVALLSAYSSQNLPTSLADQSDFIPNECGFLSVATAHNIVEEEEEEEEGNICINWDPKTRKLVFPEMVLDGLMWAEEGSENRMGGEEVHAAKGGLKLENVFVRQGSEEAAEALREKERGGESGSDGVDGVLSKWNLVISMDQ
ncbi:interleukin-20 receptor subunit alpha [Hippoglossus hippoglossus]|uniref:interleukin-20 receptor subunit alpha n=1 Tax=Hippoglossus hippoglossus TaxID=8267 RepID=UPI00148BB0A0|nr:interleukin-20 receptor subunit alpha [Hippoglossus hippoglossus]